jgi:(p)ppGpp synthase/HD superfamily hydrolase
MNATDSNLLADALGFAIEAHAGQTRKGTDVPYVTHVMRVAALVIEHGGDAEQVAAALLHDTVEDCRDVTHEVVEVKFGAEVARIVHALTDTMPGDSPEKKSPWRVRKLAYVERLAGLDARGCLVAVCDKLDNLRSLADDLRADGPSTLERFSASPRQTRWYYETVRGVLDEIPMLAAEEYDRLLAELAGHVAEASIER